MPRLHPKRVPDLAIRFIARKEGFLPQPSDALDGHATIGHGRLLHLGPVTEADRRRWGTITRKEAAAMLRVDVAATAREVRRLVDVPLNRRQFAMLISFAYNCGSNALAESTLLRKLNAGDYASVPSELNRWVSGPSGPLPGLVIRRREEGRRFRPLHKPNPKFWRKP